MKQGPKGADLQRSSRDTLLPPQEDVRLTLSCGCKTCPNVGTRGHRPHMNPWIQSPQADSKLVVSSVCPWQTLRPLRGLFVPLQGRADMSVHSLRESEPERAPAQLHLCSVQTRVSWKHHVYCPPSALGVPSRAPTQIAPGGLLKSTTSSSQYVMGSSRSLLQALLKRPDVLAYNNVWSATGMQKIRNSQCFRSAWNRRNKQRNKAPTSYY